MEDVKEKCCPFLVLRIEHLPVLKGHGTIEVDEFLPCHGKDCAAYYNGGCMRLVPPALMIGDSPLRMRTDLTDDDIEKLREELKKAPITLAPTAEVTHEPEFFFEKGNQPHGAEQFAKACAVCLNEKSDLCRECKMGKKSGFVPPF